jgi:hypothetical protein
MSLVHVDKLSLRKGQTYVIDLFYGILIHDLKYIFLVTPTIFV